MYIQKKKKSSEKVEISFFLKYMYVANKSSNISKFIW